MVIRKGSIVVHRDSESWDDTNFRVEDVDGHTATLRNLETYAVTKENVDELAVLYQTDTFDAGDIVRVRRDYADQYNEADGGNELTVVTQYTGNAPTTRVENNCGERFNVLTERIHLVRPGKSFKAGDRVVVDLDLAKKYGNDGIAHYWRDTGVLVLTEDSGSRAIKITSHVRNENDEFNTNNVPTRWLKPYVEPAKRVVGETVKVADVKVGDKVKGTFTVGGLLYEVTGVVAETESHYGVPMLNTKDGALFPEESRGAVFTLLEEAPEPVDENLQRLLDAEVGDIAHGTYSGDYYWKKVGEDEWKMLDDRHLYDTESVFYELFKVKYGELHIYRKVESDN